MAQLITCLFSVQKTEENSLLSRIQMKELTKTVPQDNKSRLVSTAKAVTSHPTTPEQNGRHSRTQQVVMLQLTHHIMPYMYVVHYFTVYKKFSSGFQWHCSSMGFHCFRRAILADQKARCAAGLPPLPHTAVSPLMSHAGCQLRR